MNKRTAWISSLLLAGAALSASPAAAQMPAMPTYGPMAGMPNPYAPPMYAVAPAGYGDPSAPSLAPQPMMGPPPGAYPDQSYAGEMYAGERCDTCGPHFGHRLHGLLRWFLPFDDGGCCAPHWFDVHAEYVRLRRDDVGSNTDFMAADPLGPIVLSTNDLEFDPESGFRATVTMQLGVGSNLEFTYMGAFNWASEASVTGPDNLFSVFSDFGRFPTPGQGFTETDEAAFASIAYSSTFDNFELNFRQRWQGFGCKLQGSWLAGGRYFQLNEDFRFITEVPTNNARADYLVSTQNELVGLQIGGDIWACLIPGFSIGAEGKVGIYGNTARQHTVIDATTVVPALEENLDDADVAFIGEMGLMANWRLSQSWTFRGGYEFLYVTGVALAPENFNATPPFLVPAFTNPPRVPLLNAEGEVFYHGLTAGFEYMW